MTTGIASVTIEIGFGYAPLTAPNLITWTDVTADVISVTTNRGRSAALEQWSPGTATITLRNQTGNYDVQNASGPYYGNLRPFTPVRIKANDSTSTTFNIFYGFINLRAGITLTESLQGRASTATITCTDFLTIISSVALPAVNYNDPTGIDYEPQKYAGLHSGEQVASLMTDGLLPGTSIWWGGSGPGLSAFSTNIPQGQALVQPYRGGQNALDWLHQMAATEGGDLYVDRDGVVNFNHRYAVISAGRMTTSQATFDDSGAAVSYSDLKKDFGTVFYNKAIISVQDQAAQTVADSGSIGNYTESDFTATLFSNDQAEAAARATWIVDSFVTPVSAPDSIVVYPRRSNTVLDAALHRELRDRVTVKRTPVGTSTQRTMNCFVRSLAHTINRASGEWTVTIGLEDADRYNFTDYTKYLIYDNSQAYDSTNVWGF